MEPSHILSFAAKWEGERDIMFFSCQDGDREGMIKEIYSVLSQADMVVHFNGRSFDIPRINQEFKKFGLTPPAPFKQVDLYRVVKSKFDLPSNKLDYVVQYFGLGKKVKHPGMDLWRGCLDGDEKSWSTMERYNRGDVRLTERLYKSLLPWIDNHPSVSLYDEDGGGCPNCGGTRLNKRGLERTSTRVYQRYHCRGCGKWCKAVRCEPRDKKATPQVKG